MRRSSKAGGEPEDCLSFSDGRPGLRATHRAPAISKPEVSHDLAEGQTPYTPPMRMKRAEFLRWPNKAITLLGMSGVGKTTLAYKLPRSKWFHYSGDYRI